MIWDQGFRRKRLHYSSSLRNSGREATLGRLLLAAFPQSARHWLASRYTTSSRPSLSTSLAVLYASLRRPLAGLCANGVKDQF